MPSDFSKKPDFKWRSALISLGLVLITVLVYWPVHHANFLNYDDPSIFQDNPFVQYGLTWRGIVWGATTSYYEYWHPLMWWSHELDCQLFGLNAGPHHLVSLGFHVINSLLVFAIFRRMTGMVWRSAMVAALFALHPLHVESVAWLAERKDVLSTLFWLLSLWAYARFAEVSKNTGAEPRGSKSKVFYGLSLFFFLLGLLSKPMVVTLPFVLLLLDYWPLNRIADWGLRIGDLKARRHDSLAWLAWEKWPFFVLMTAGCVVTWHSTKLGNHVRSSESLSWSVRLSNVPVAYVRYLGKTIWPVHHAPLYLIPDHWEWWQVGGASVLLVFLTWLFVWRWRSTGYLGFGWLMFLGTLVPTIGIVSVGSQAIAERYMYVPAIGLFAAAVWGMADISNRWKKREVLLGGLAVAIITICALLTRAQLPYWNDSLALWKHCVEEEPDQGFLRAIYGRALTGAGEPEKALEQYKIALNMAPGDELVNTSYAEALASSGRESDATNYFATALRINPLDADAHDHMGIALFDLGDFAGARSEFAEAIRLDQYQMDAYVSLARALSALGKSDEALQWYASALEHDPKYASAYYFRGLDYAKRGAFNEAVSNLQVYIQTDPNQPLALLTLAEAHSQMHDLTGAIAEYHQALHLNPDLLEALNNLAWLRATAPDPQFRNGAEAVKLAEHACELSSWQKTMFVGTLAAAYAEAGDFDKAVQTAQKACDLAAAQGENELLQKNRALLDQYKAHQPAREN